MSEELLTVVAEVKNEAGEIRDGDGARSSCARFMRYMRQNQELDLA